MVSAVLIKSRLGSSTPRSKKASGTQHREIDEAKTPQPRTDTTPIITTTINEPQNVAKTNAIAKKGLIENGCETGRAALALGHWRARGRRVRVRGQLSLRMVSRQNTRARQAERLTNISESEEGPGGSEGPLCWPKCGQRHNYHRSSGFQGARSCPFLLFSPRFSSPRFFLYCLAASLRAPLSGARASQRWM